MTQVDLDRTTSPREAGLEAFVKLLFYDPERLRVRGSAGR